MGDNTRYSLADAAMGAFSVFFTQSPSFLDAQRTLQVKKGCNNTHTLFGMTQIPSDNHIRNLLDPVPPHELFPVFSSLVDGLNAAGHLEVYRSINGDLLVALDGTQYFASAKIHCEQCSVKHHKGKRTFTDTYRWIKQVPLRDGDDARRVNWCELTTTDDNGKVIYKNAFATNHAITADNVADR